METKFILLILLFAFLKTTIITGANNEVESNNISGSLDSAPKFKSSPIHDVVALAGGSHKFTCKVRGSPKPFIVWYHGNEMLEQNNRIQIGKYSMKISNLQTTDSGKYSCKASNKHGTIWGNFTLHVVRAEEEVADPDDFDYLKGPPQFKRRLNQVRSLARAASASVDFDCDVLAYPEAKIIWLKNGRNVKHQPGKYMFDGYRLTVKSLVLEDSGNYTCIVCNDYGSVNWTSTLTVQTRVAIAPIMEDVKNQTALVGDNVTFTCMVVRSDSQPLLQWLRHFKKNDSFVNEKGEPYVRILQSSGFKSTIDEPQHLVLRNVTKEDEGWYTCLVANTVGMNYRSAWLTVLEIDCEVNNGGCHTHATCDNSGWVISCNCHPGYTGDGYTCSNVDECSGDFYPCLRDYTCEDQDPGYSCAPQVKSDPTCTTN